MRRPLLGSKGESNMVEHHGSFVWYELMTTDMAAAATFYAFGVQCHLMLEATTAKMIEL